MAKRSYSLSSKDLSIGTHNITVVAKGSGYADSLPSDPVSYEVPGTPSDPSVHELNIMYQPDKQKFEEVCGGVPSVTPQKLGQDLVQSAGSPDLTPYNLDEQGQDEIQIQSFAYLQQDASISERLATEGYIQINGTKYYGTNSDAPNLYRESAEIGFVLGNETDGLALTPIQLVLTYNDTISFTMTGGPQGDTSYDELQIDTWEQFVEEYPEFIIDENGHVVSDDSYAVHYSGEDVSTVGAYVMKTDKIKNGSVYWLVQNS